MNVEHFKDLPDDIAAELQNYIDNSYMPGMDNHTAYGLKQHFTSTHPHEGFHITSRCFMEAMVSRGYEAFRISGAKEPNWQFHLKVLNPES